MDEIYFGNYLEFLLDKVNRRGYFMSDLIDIMHAATYAVKIDVDSSRVEDALELREEFELCTGLRISSAISVSVLEVLVALAIRIELEWVGDPYNPNPDHIFDNMIEKLFAKCFNIHDQLSMQQCINDFIDRNYDPNGFGSPFPLRDNHGIDQRYVSLWEQAMAYVNEGNYS